MTFENVIKKISAFCATAIIFTITLGIYLSSKGFVMDNDGNINLVSRANAQAIETSTTSETKNIIDKTVNINIDTPHFMGKEDAEVTMYEYSSFGCTHCADFHLFTLPQIKKEFIDTGKLKLVFVDFPLDKKSMQASLLSYCVPKESYYEYLNLVFKKQNEWSLSFKTDKILTGYASLFGLSSVTVKKCLKDETVQNRILANRQQGIESFKIQGTPSFVMVHKDGRKEALYGASSYEEFAKKINSLLAE